MRAWASGAVRAGLRHRLWMAVTGLSAGAWSSNGGSCGPVVALYGCRAGEVDGLPSAARIAP